MRRLVPGGADFFDQALRLTGFRDVTGAVGKLAGVGVANIGVTASQGRELGRVDTVLLFSPTAQEVQAFLVNHSIGADGGAAGAAMSPADPNLVGRANLATAFSVVQFTDSSTVAGGVAIADFPLLANTVFPWTIPQDLSNLSSLLFVAQTVATRLVGTFSLRARHMRNFVLLQSGG